LKLRNPWAPMLRSKDGRQWFRAHVETPLHLAARWSRDAWHLVLVKFDGQVQLAVLRDPCDPAPTWCTTSWGGRWDTSLCRRKPPDLERGWLVSMPVTIRPAWPNMSDARICPDCLDRGSVLQDLIKRGKFVEAGSSTRGLDIDFGKPK
jgi:hypothetical protein